VFLDPNSAGEAIFWMFIRMSSLMIGIGIVTGVPQIGRAHI
jgi:hypothetical protein